MKKDWVYKKLGEVCEIYQPTTIATSQLIPNGKYLVYGANGVIGRYNEYNHEEAEVLLCCRGATCGAINLSQPKSWVNGNAMVVKPKTNEIIKNFLIYLLTSLDYTHIITGAAQPQITRKSLFPVSIGLPPLSEQKEIVEYLDSSFAKIDKLKENAAKNLEEAKALFQSALKDALEPKEGWEEKTLGEIGEIKVGPFGSLLHKRDYILGGTPLINPMHIINGRIYADDSFTISQNKRDELSSYIMKTDDIIIGRRGEIGRCAVVGITENGYICGTGSMFFRPNKNKINSTYLQLLLSSDFTKKKLEAISGGATMKNLSSTALGKFVTQIPLLSEQQSIVSYLDSLNEKVNTLQQNYSRICDECDALKQAILRQVFE